MEIYCAWIYWIQWYEFESMDLPDIFYSMEMYNYHGNVQLSCRKCTIIIVFKMLDGVLSLFHLPKKRQREKHYGTCDPSRIKTAEPL